MLISISFTAYSQKAVKVKHNNNTGVTAIEIKAEIPVKAKKINIYRSNAPISKRNLLFCKRIVSLDKNKKSYSYTVPETGKFYYAITISDKYNRQDTSWLKTSLTGPISETCLKKPTAPKLSWRAKDGKLLLCWRNPLDSPVAKYRVYQKNKVIATVSASSADSEIVYTIPFALVKNKKYLFTLTALNTSGLESSASAPLKIALLPDLKIGTGKTIARNKDFSISKMFPVVGKPVKLGVKVYNQGLVTANNAVVTIKASSEKNSQVIARRKVSIASNKHAVIDFQWIPKSTGEYKITATLDANNKLAEINESNNSATVLVPVVSRDIYITWYGNPLHLDWCNVPQLSDTEDMAEWRRRGAIVSFIGMVNDTYEGYSRKVKKNFDGVVVDEIGTVAANQHSGGFLKWLPKIKNEHPDFFIAIWLAVSNAPAEAVKLVNQKKVDLLVIERYLRVGGGYKKALDGDIANARKVKLEDKTIIGLGSSGNYANHYPAKKHIAFLDAQMKYIYKNAPKMPGIGFFTAGTLPGVSEKIDQMCYKYFVKPAFKEIKK